MVPFLAELTVDPQFTVSITILLFAEVDLTTIVTLFVVLVALVAVLAKGDFLLEELKVDLVEVGLLLRLGGLLLHGLGHRGLALIETILLLSVVGASMLVVARELCGASKRHKLLHLVTCCTACACHASVGHRSLAIYNKSTMWCVNRANFSS